MSSAQSVWELSRAVLADQDRRIAESGIHDGSPVLTVAAYQAKPKEWRDWTKKWNAAKRPIKVYHAVDAANLQGEFEGWTAAERDKLAAKLLPLIGEAQLAGVVIGIHMEEFRRAIASHPELKEIIGNPYGACFHWVAGTIIRLANRFDLNERTAFFHEVNDYQEDARQSFKWIGKNINSAARVISLTFGSKADFVPLQAADILAYEANKRFRDMSRKPRRAWSALNPKTNVTFGHYGKHNMDKLMEGLAGLRRDLLAVGWEGKGNPYWSARAY